MELEEFKRLVNRMLLSVVLTGLVPFSKPVHISLMSLKSDAKGA